MSENKLDLITGGLSSDSLKNENETSLSENVYSFLGDAILNDSDVNSIESQSKPEVTILVGFPDYGKTSFVASLYHIAISTGKIGDWECYDSDTFVGFERRLFLRRYNTADIPAGTLRTIRGEAHILTLKLIKDGIEKTILVSDHSGEDYAEYANNPSKINKDELLHNCNRIIILVDSSILISKKNLSMKNRYENLLEGMKNAGIFDNDKELLIVFNKYDMIPNSELELFDKRESEFTNFVTNICGTLVNKIFKIQANNVDDAILNECITYLSESPNIACEQSIVELNRLNWVNSILNKEKL